RGRELTSKRHSGKDVKQIIAELTPVLRGWGNYFRTLAPLAVPTRRATANEAAHVHLGSAVRDGTAPIDGHREIPGASHTQKIIGKPCAGKRHARFERGY